MYYTVYDKLSFDKFGVFLAVQTKYMHGFTCRATHMCMSFQKHCAHAYGMVSLKRTVLKELFRKKSSMKSLFLQIATSEPDHNLP